MNNGTPGNQALTAISAVFFCLLVMFILFGRTGQNRNQERRAIEHLREGGTSILFFGDK